MDYFSPALYAKRLRAQSLRPCNLPPIIAITDHRAIPDMEAQIRSLPPGSAVILRDYDHPNRELLAHTALRLCRRLRHILLIAGDPALAERVRADGVHFPEWQWQHIRLWRNRHPNWCITTTAHHLTTLVRLHSCGADAALLSPVFATKSHPGSVSLGRMTLRKLQRLSPLPVYALGGIDRNNVSLLSHSQISGIATIRGLQ